MNGKSGMVLLLAIVCGLGAMYGVRRVLSSKSNANATVPVLVAARDLKAEEVLKEDMVKVVPVPKALAPASRLTTFREIAERSLKMPILADEPIIEAKLSPKNAPKGLVAQIPVGKRAIAVEVNEQTGVSGFILPEHRVDLIQGKSTPNGPELAETILEDVLVLAAGTTNTRAEDKSIQVRTVTVALDPEQVNTLVAARSKGPLSLSLRGLHDREPMKKAKPTPKAETKPVIVASRDLRPDEPLRPEMVRLTQVPKSEAPATAFGSIAEIVGRRPSMPIFAGEPIVSPKLAAPGQVVGKIRPRAGMRAVALPLGETSGLAGAIQAGHHVDVVWVKSSPRATDADTAGPSTSRVVLQDARVLEAPAGEPTITLEVNARDLTALALAKSSGTLTFALRDPEDHRSELLTEPATPRVVERYGAIYRGLAPPQRFLVERRVVMPDSSWETKVAAHRD